MSTRIHNGIRFSGVADINQFQQVMQDIKKVIETQKEQAIIAQFKRYALDFIYQLIQYESDPAQLLDRLNANKLIENVELSDLLHSSIWGYFTQYLARAVNMAKNSGRLMDNECDLKAEIVTFTHNDQLYGMYYFGREGHYEKRFLAHPSVKDFSYWDNTDMPDELDDNEWSLRRDVWNNIFSQSYTPSEVGMTIRLTNPEPDIFYSEHMPAQKEVLNNMLALIDDKNAVLDMFARKFIEQEVFHKKMRTYGKEITASVVHNMSQESREQAHIEEASNTDYWQQARGVFEQRLDAFLTPEGLKRSLFDIALTK